MEMLKGQQKNCLKIFLLPLRKTTKPISLLLIFSILFLTLGFNTPNVLAINVNAQVLVWFTQTFLKEKEILLVRQKDIAKGYVDVPVGTILRVMTNVKKEGYFLHIGMRDFVREVMITINGRAVEVPPGGGLVHLVSSSKEETLDIGYRLFIADGTVPGTYSWPVSISASLI